MFVGSIIRQKMRKVPIYSSIIADEGIKSTIIRQKRGKVTDCSFWEECFFKKIGKSLKLIPRPSEKENSGGVGMHEAKTEAARNIKMSREAELNMERCAEFMARMILKYGKKVLDDITAEEKVAKETEEKAEDDE